MDPVLVLVLALATAEATTTNHTEGNYKCADVYCINLDTYSKLDVPTSPVKVSVDLDVLQILDVDDVKFTVSFSMYFGVRSVRSNINLEPYPQSLSFVWLLPILPMCVAGGWSPALKGPLLLRIIHM